MAEDDLGPRVDAWYTRALNEWLERPDVKLTRALKKLDWPTARELYDALELKVSQYEEYDDVLARVVRTGNVTRRRDDGAVRYQLFLEIPPPDPNARVRPDKPGLEGEERGGFFFWRGTWRPL